MNNYPKKSSDNKFANYVVIFTIFILVIISTVFVTSILMKSDSNKTEEVILNKTDSVDNGHAETSDDKTLDISNESNQISNIPYYATVEDYVVQYVRPRYNSLHANTGLTEKSLSPSTKIYRRNDNTLAKVIVKDSSNERWFFYDESETLIFVYIYQDYKEHRYYFKNAGLVRYKDPYGNQVDNPTNSEVQSAAKQLVAESNIYR